MASAGAISFPQFLPVNYGVTLTAAGALAYNATKGNRAVFIVDFGFGTTGITQPNFTVNFPANGPNSALLRILGGLGQNP